MMMIFLDTEFTGLDQDKPDLISIALVDEAGREFYAELPPAHYAVQCNEWVHVNVLPHLWAGDHVRSVAATRDRLAGWFAGISDRAVIVTDCPDPAERVKLFETIFADSLGGNFCLFVLQRNRFWHIDPGFGRQRRRLGATVFESIRML